MKKYCAIFLCAYTVSGLSQQAQGFDLNDTMTAAYIEQTNGTYAVCAYDMATATLFQFNGVFIAEEQLPHISPIGSSMCFALGDQPPYVINESDLWKPREENARIYGPIPYPIEEVEPPLIFRTTDKFDVVLGINLRGIFVGFENLGKIQQNIGVSFPPINAEGVVFVSTPEHRESEVLNLINKNTSEQDLPKAEQAGPAYPPQGVGSADP